jgi:hypothetical protein
MSRWTFGTSLFLTMTLAAGCGLSRGYTVGSPVAQPYVSTPSYTPPIASERPSTAPEEMPAPVPLETPPYRQEVSQGEPIMAPEPPPIMIGGMPPLPPDLERASDEFFHIPSQPVATR